MPEQRVHATAETSRKVAQELAGWLTTVLAETLQADPETIAPDVPLWEYGMDSLVVATLLAELDEERGIWLDPAEVSPGMSLTQVATLVTARPEGGYGDLTEEEADVA